MALTRADVKVAIVTPGLGRANRGSFWRLAESFHAGLSAWGVKSFLWDAPRDPQESDERFPPLAGVTHLLYVGPPVFADWVHFLFDICKRKNIDVLFSLYANSTTLPPNVLGFLRQYPISIIVTGSEWSAKVIRSTGAAQPVVVVPPGVEVPDEVPVTEPSEWAHAVAGTSGRKGTEELLVAVGADINLAIYADALAFPWASRLAAGKRNVRVLRSYDGRDAPAWWGHQHVVHPSRAEGFGIGLVEAYLLGRTVVARRATGEPHVFVHTITWRHGHEPWEEWEGGDGGRMHPLGAGIDELRIANPVDIRQAMLAAWGRRGRIDSDGEKLVRHGVFREPVLMGDFSEIDRQAERVAFGHKAANMGLVTFLTGDRFG